MTAPIKVRLCLSAAFLPVQLFTGDEDGSFLPDGLEGEVVSYEENDSVVIVKFEDLTIALPAQYLSRLH